MARKELTVEPRQITGKKVAQLRREGILPANVYGKGLESVSLQISSELLRDTIKTMSANEVLDLKIEGERAARPVIIQRVQRHPVNSAILHADFYQVSLREKMRADVPIVLTGSSEAVGTYNGVIMLGTEAVSIEALPLDVPSSFELDISALANLEDALYVRDIAIPESLTVLTDPDLLVVKVASPRVSAEDAAADSEAAAPAGAEAEETTAEAEGEEPAAEAESDGEGGD